jgi:hypothetical protein
VRLLPVLLLVLLQASCAGELADPERFEPGGGGSVDAAPGGGADGNPTGGDGDAAPGGGCAVDPLNDIILPRCAGGACHDADGPAANLDLASADHAARLIDVASSCNDLPLVNGADRPVSYLLEKLESTPTCGNSMPPGSPLSADQIACVREWVEGL